MSTLTDYRLPDPAMYDDYEVQGAWVAPPQAKATAPTGKVSYIKYRATMPGAEHYTFEADKQGFWRVVIEGIVLDGGYTLRKTYLSSQPFAKRDKAGNVTGHRNANAFGNFLRAFAMGVKPTSVAEYEAFALATVGQQCQVTIDWEAYDGEAQQTVATSWDAFPAGEVPGEKQLFIEQGEKKYWARASIKRFVDAIGG